MKNKLNNKKRNFKEIECKSNEEMLSISKKKVQELYVDYVSELSNLPTVPEDNKTYIINRTSLGAREFTMRLTTRL